MPNRILTVGATDLLGDLDDACAQHHVERAHSPRYPEALELARSLRPSLVLVDAAAFEPAVTLIRSLRYDPSTAPLNLAAVLPSVSEAAERALQDAGADVVLTGVVDAFTWDAHLEPMLTAPRRPALGVPVSIRTWMPGRAGDPLTGEALDISPGGMLLATQVELEIGSKLDLRFSLPGTPEELHAVAQVVRKAGRAGERWLRGVEFLVLKGQTRERIALFIEQATARLVPRSSGRPRLPTERTSWEAQLRASEARKRAILDSVSDAIVTIDRAGRIVECNSAAERIFGYPRAELLGRAAQETLAPSLFAPDRGGLMAIAATSGPQGFQTKGRRKDGSEFDMEIAVAPVDLNAERAFTACCRDISERQRLEAQLRQAQKMDAVGRLAGGVAHDFNNLLNVILGYAELLGKSLPAGSPEARRSQQIVRAAERAAGLTRQLLAFSRKQPQQRVVLDLNELVEGLRDMLGRLVGEHFDLVVELASGLGRVSADRGQIEQVLTNLVVNARDAMPGGGRIVIRSGNEELDSRYAREHAGAQPGSYVRLEVEDAGVGMDAETQRRLFEPFFTTKEVGKGTGLGLATVYGIVKQSLGYVTVESSPGSGARFTVFLPRLPAEAALAEPADPGRRTTPAATRRGQTVLVVEDQEMLRAMVCEVLEAAGHRVLTAANGEEALRVAAAHAGPIALILADVVMPKMTGPELALRLGSAHPTAKVLFVSGYPSGVASGEAALDPDIPFLQKPFTAAALLAKVSGVLGET